MPTNSGPQLYFSYFLIVLFLSVLGELFKGNLLITKLLYVILKQDDFFKNFLPFGPSS